MRVSILIVKVLASVSLCGLLQLYCLSTADAQSPPTDRAEAPATSQLVGTIESDAFSGAVFDDGSGNQSFYRIHDRLPDESQIKKIGEKSILLKRSDGDFYEMFVTGGKGSAVPQYMSPRQPTLREPTRRGRSGRTRTDSNDE